MFCLSTYNEKLLRSWAATAAVSVVHDENGNKLSAQGLLNVPKHNVYLLVFFYFSTFFTRRWVRDRRTIFLVARDIV